MYSVRLFLCKPRLIFPRLNCPNETQQTTTMTWSPDDYNKTLRQILFYPKVTANMSFYSGVEGSVNGRENMARRKVKNGVKSP